MTATIPRVCEWTGCLRAARSSHSRYCVKHRPWCARAGCPNRALPDRPTCRAHRPDRPGPRLGGRQPKRHVMGAEACAVDGCERRPLARGLCGTHYRRQRRTGSTADPFPAGAWCHYCAERATAPDGLCHEHRRRVRLRGDPLRAVRQSPKLPAQGRECIEGDGRPVFRHALCSTHYWRRWRVIRNASRSALAAIGAGGPSTAPVGHPRASAPTGQP